MDWKLQFQESIFQCHLKYSDGTVKTVSVLSVKQMSEAVWGYYPAFFVICPLIALRLDDEKISLPIFIQISHKNKQSRSHKYYVEIKYPKLNIKSQYNSSIALCPGPAHSNFKDALRIVEFVELYKILGVEKFYFYNMSISNDVNKLFEHYRSTDTAEILRWDIDHVMKMDEEIIHYFGIMATLNDCFYRASFVDGFKYIIIADFDEIILPMKHMTLFEFLDEHDNDSIHSFVIRNFFVFGKFESDFSNVPENAVNKFLYTQAKIIRIKNSIGDYKWFNVRTKLIGKRDEIIEIGNHYVWEAFSGTKEHYVDSKDALMLHYRDKCTAGKADCLQGTVKDYSTRKFGEQLWKEVDRVCAKIFDDGICPGGEFDSDRYT